MPPQPFPQQVPVSRIGRRSSRFEPRDLVIHEAAAAAAPNIGAQKILDGNLDRIVAVVFAPVTNPGTIWIVRAGTSNPGGGASSVGTWGLETPPGTGWEIDDTTDALYAYSGVGGGDQHLVVYEAVDDTTRQARRAGLI